MARASTRADSMSTSALVILVGAPAAEVSLAMTRNLSSGKYIDPISHDGVHDSLTHLAAPGYFYEHLYREVAKSDRDGSPITILRVILRHSDGQVNPSDYEIALINLAKALTKVVRASDVVARVGRFEFYALLNIESNLVEGFANRISKTFHSKELNKEYLAQTSSVTRLPGEKPIELMVRLDFTESIH
jgi:GGDEF domain-containing protein